MEQPIIFAARSGLSNRLRAMVGAKALAHIDRVPLLIYWEKHGSCFSNFEDLYDLSSWENTTLIDKAEADHYKATNPERHFDTAEWFTDIWTATSNHQASFDAYCQCAVSYLRLLRPRPELQSIVDEYAELNQLDQCVGIHIRLTDNVHAYDVWKKSDPHFNYEKISSLDGFRKEIKNLKDQGKRVFLSTDNQGISDQLSSEFVNIIKYGQIYDDTGHLKHISSHYGGTNKKTSIAARLMKYFVENKPGSWRTTSIQDALADLMLLSRCSRIIGTYYSSFSQISSLIGGNPLSIQTGKDITKDTFIANLNFLAGKKPADV